MQIKRLWLKEFRNYENLDVSFPEGVSVLVGQNGQGKTSILEAIGYLVSHQSIRGAPNSAIPRHQNLRQTLNDEASLGGEFMNTSGASAKLTLEIPSAGRLRAKLNSAKSPSRQELQTRFPIVTFLPSHLELISGSAMMRRDLFDRAVLINYPAHQSTYLEMNQALKQRNAFLKSLKSSQLSPSELDLLDIYDAQFSKHGEEWAEMRQAAVPVLETQVREIYEAIAGEESQISLKYKPSWGEQALVQVLRQERGRDLARGTTSFGPHRDDLEIILHNLPARYTASRGEQRSLTVSLIFSIHRFIAERGELPLLLLDDILSEFDAKKSSALIQNFSTEQIFVTTTDLEASKLGFQDAAIFEVSTDENGVAFLQ